MSLLVSYGCSLSLTVPTSAMQFLHISHRFVQFHGVAACLSLSVMVAKYLSLSLRVPPSCYLSLTVPSSSMEILHISPYSYGLCLSVSM